MEIVQDDLWFCTDCTLYAVNDDLTGIDYYLSGAEAKKREKEVTKGVNSFGKHLVPDFDSGTGEGMREFSSRSCDDDGEPMTDEKWMADLAERLAWEASDAAHDAREQAKEARGKERKELLADEKALLSIAEKATKRAGG